MPPTWEITQIAGYANYFATVAATKAAVSLACCSCV